MPPVPDDPVLSKVIRHAVNGVEIEPSVADGPTTDDPKLEMVGCGPCVGDAHCGHVPLIGS